MAPKYEGDRPWLLSRIASVAFGLALVAWGCADAADGRVAIGWSSDHEYEVRGALAYVATAGVLAFGLGSIVFGVRPHRMPRALVGASLVGALAWFAVLLYVTATQPAA